MACQYSAIRPAPWPTSINGDKYSTIQYFWTLSQQHGQLWVGTGLLPANMKANGPADVNWTAGFAGALAVSPSDASPDEAPQLGDLETAKLLGRRVAELATRSREVVRGVKAVPADLLMASLRHGRRP